MPGDYRAGVVSERPQVSGIRGVVGQHGFELHHPREPACRLAVYSYATRLLGYTDPGVVRLLFGVLTKTRVPELHRYWTTRDRATNMRLVRMAAKVLAALEAGVFHPVVGWQCKECPFRSKCWAWR